MKLKSSCIILLSINSLYANAEVTLDGTLGRGGTLPGPDYLIGADLGRQNGGNLFHSFQDFNLNHSESATFSGPNSVSNIISRVTGGNPSQIDGLIRSTIPNADMYFLNPYGIMFGPNARLDVQGSFHASTADYFRLGEGGRFDARNPSNSLLTIAPIESFGFLNSQIAPISIQGHGEVTQDWLINRSTGLSVQESKTLSLIGGQIDMWMGTYFKTMTIDDEGNESPEMTRFPTLSAPSGRINLASVASRGEVKLGGDFMDVSSFSQLADIHIKEKSLLQTSGEGGGNIFIRSGQLFVDNSDIDAKTLGNRNGGSVDVQANMVSFFNGAVINGHTFGSGTGVDVNIQATESVRLIGENSEGQQTRILVRSGDESDEEKENVNMGDAGTVFIKAKNIYLNEGAGISVSTFTKGSGGNAILNASEDIVFIGKESNHNYRSYIASATAYKGEGAGNGGNIFIEAKNILFSDGAYINSRTIGKGNAGTITLNAENQLSFTGLNGNGSSSRIYANVSSKSQGGNSGNIFIEAQEILLTDGAYFNSTSFGLGKAGNIDVHATGTITIIGTNERGWRSAISSGSNPKKEGIIGGEGGNITIEAAKLVVKDGAAIAANSIAPKGIQSGEGGNIAIRVQGAVELYGVNPYGENEDGFGSGIYARSIGVEDNAGDAGKITLQAGSLIIKDGAVIISGTNNNAQGGNIDIDVRGAVTITGDASNILREPASAQLEYLQGFSPSNYNQSTSGIYASSENKTDQAGQGGNITLTAQNLILTNKGKISTSSAGGAKAGNIIIEVAQLQLDGSSSIASESRLPNNAYEFANLAERDSHILISGDIVKVADIGNGKPGRYINTGKNLIRTTPVDTVANLTALHELTNKYGIAKGDIIEVKDAGNGESARFIYAYHSSYDLAEWVIFDDKVTVTFENMTELKTGWFKPEDVPYPSGEVIQVNNIGDGKPAIFIYSSGIVSPITGSLYGQALKVNAFNIADTTALNELRETTFVEAGDIANVINVGSRFVFNGKNWDKLNKRHMVADIAAMNALTIAQTGTIAEIAQVESGQPARFIYSGEQWLSLNSDEAHHTVQNLAELNKLSGQTGEIVSVLDAGNGQHEKFFYANGEWKKQIRGGNAGTITITTREGIRLSSDSAITTESNSAGGGSLNIKTDGLFYLTNSNVTTSVEEGIGQGGDMTVNANFVVLENGKIIARAYEGDGGNMNITTTGIYRFGDESASPIDASSKLGIDGEVKVDLPNENVTESLLALPTTPIDNVSTFSKNPCEVHSLEEYTNRSRFDIHPIAGSPTSPFDLQPSRFSFQSSKITLTTSQKQSQKMTSPSPHQMALLSVCQPSLNQSERQAVQENSVIPEPPLF